MNKGILVSASVILLVGVSGCLGGGGGSMKASSSSAPASSAADPGTTLLRGWVFTTDLAPLPVTRVTILGSNATKVTDARGAYLFDGLAPSEYVVTASKDGYRAKSQRAFLASETILELNFTLEEVPVQQAYHELQEFKGLIACSLAYGAADQEPSVQDCGAIDANNRPAKDFLIPAGLAEIQIEAFWTPKTPAAENLHMSVDTVGLGHQDTQVGTIDGKSGLKLHLSKSLLDKYYGAGGQLRVELGPAMSVAGDEAHLDAGVAFQQDFTVFLTQFFVDPGPSDYTAQPG